MTPDELNQIRARDQKLRDDEEDIMGQAEADRRDLLAEIDRLNGLVEERADPRARACVNCGTVYLPKREPAEGRRNFCEVCTEKPARALAAKDYRARKRARA